jgi:hypothetical protein
MLLMYMQHVVKGVQQRKLVKGAVCKKVQREVHPNLLTFVCCCRWQGRVWCSAGRGCDRQAQPSHWQARSRARR